jgi:hypothetical protein
MSLLLALAPDSSAARARGRHAALCLLAFIVVSSGCAAPTALRNGRDAERLQDYDRAVVEYTKALRLTRRSDARSRSIAPGPARRRITSSAPGGSRR